MSLLTAFCGVVGEWRTDAVCKIKFEFQFLSVLWRSSVYLKFEAFCMYDVAPSSYSIGIGETWDQEVRRNLIDIKDDENQTIRLIWLIIKDYE